MWVRKGRSRRSEIKENTWLVPSRFSGLKRRLGMSLGKYIFDFMCPFLVLEEVVEIKFCIKIFHAGFPSLFSDHFKFLFCLYGWIIGIQL